MQNPSAAIADLKKRVLAAREEVDEAVAYHELWKPAAFDKDLHTRLGASIATKGFLVVRTALQREMLLALARIWDGTKKTIQAREIARKLSNQSVFEALLLARAESMQRQFAVKRVRGPSERTLQEDLISSLRDSLNEKRIETISLIEKYDRGGPANNVLRHIEWIRHERLAHRAVSPTQAPGPTVTDTEVQVFYEDNLEIIRLLMSLICATAYDLTQTAGVMAHHSRFFWASVRGEKTKGHPNFRPPID